ncbi:MAG: UDP-N-acetylmuramoyl-L-alanyl-D-glutamate--2,6-diaminopimelate ligase [Pelolinea sp.]|nr:UDP-N-acetylmuramoyl-L-alanyl-D-glutamate--2,6-diaminopimelate ligase [Pelolinea sp.]
MFLSELLSRSKQFKEETISNIQKIEITGISHDSRELLPGNLFVALTGDSFDGYRYIQDAIDNGAVAVVGERKLNIQGVPYFKVNHSRLSLAYLSAAYNDFPSTKLTVIGVTGTDGKTTTVNLIHNILISCGVRAGMISTVNAIIGNEQIDTGFHVTTPESPKIQGLLKKMVDRGLTHVVIEATSHGLEQFRVAACNFDISVVTNITHEHLDYHGDYNKYVDAKAALLIGLVETNEKVQGNYRIAILNRDDQSYDQLIEKLSEEKYRNIEIISYGMNRSSDVIGKNIHNIKNGLEFTIELDGKEYEILTSLIGEYNAQNILAAVTATTKGLGMKMKCVKNGIAKLSGVPGRMESIDLGQKFSAIVDFAHTPNALKVALETSRNRTDKRIIAVFGSAGLRDREKRRMMAATSIELSDISILTAEDPRTENLDEILSEMADEARQHGGIENSTFYRISDRGSAIRKAVELAKEDDLVIICGKGHEQSMCFGETEYPWDDRIALRSALSSLLKIAGPEMPYLPTQE